MDKSLGEKIRNYFSDRIEEIQDGSYVPTWKQIKELPEFSGISREIFKIARKRWYSQNFGMSFRTFNEDSKRYGTIKAKNISNNEYDKRNKKKIGFCILTIGVLSILLSLFVGNTLHWDPSYVGGYFLYTIVFMGIGIILLVIGLGMVLYNRSKFSEKESSIISDRQELESDQKN